MVNLIETIVRTNMNQSTTCDHSNPSCNKVSYTNMNNNHKPTNTLKTGTSVMIIWGPRMVVAPKMVHHFWTNPLGVAYQDLPSTILVMDFKKRPIMMIDDDEQIL